MTGCVFSPGRELTIYRTQGLDVQISVKTLAGCGPSEERNEQYPKRNFLQGMTDMLHNKRRKSKGENKLISNIYMQEMLQVL
jgi:hypothetical protein